MADEVHVHQTPPPAGDGGGGGGTNALLVVVVLLLVGLIAWFMFRGGGDAVEEAGESVTEVNVEAPEIDIPDEVDVNVK